MYVECGLARLERELKQQTLTRSASKTEPKYTVNCSWEWNLG